MKILYINNSGSGFADYVEASEGMTVEKFFHSKMAGERPEDHLIRVNRQPVPRDYVLQEGDRVTITPTKIEGLPPSRSHNLVPTTKGVRCWQSGGCPFPLHGKEKEL